MVFERDGFRAFSTGSDVNSPFHQESADHLIRELAATQ